MSGFEHQVASHMMAEGMVDEALLLTRAVHDRYHASKRNPFNEIECSDHYARAMASYGTFITACGFTYHGPNGTIGFAPKLNKANFKAAFTVAEGWGTYSQTRKGKQQEHRIQLRYGKLKLHQLKLEKTEKVSSLSVTLDNNRVAAEFEQRGGSVQIKLTQPTVIISGQVLTVQI